MVGPHKFIKRSTLLQVSPYSFKGHFIVSIWMRIIVSVLLLQMQILGTWALSHNIKRKQHSVSNLFQKSHRYPTILTYWSKPQSCKLLRHKPFSCKPLGCKHFRCKPFGCKPIRYKSPWCKPKMCKLKRRKPKMYKPQRCKPQRCKHPHDSQIFETIFKHCEEGRFCWIVLGL